jgi:hypothetical protein
VKFGPRTRAFLAAIRVMPHITRAAQAAGIRRELHYRRLERSPEYKKAFEEAWEVGCTVLEEEAYRRAVEGVERPVLYHGKVVRVKRKPLMEREYSDALLLRLLSANKPEKYRERVEHTGKDGAPIEAKLEVVFVTAADHANRVPPEAPISV